MKDDKHVRILALERLKNRKIKVYTTEHDQIFVEDVIVKFRLLKDRVLEAKEWQDALHAEKKAEAMASALHYLSYGSRSASQVRARLAKDELPQVIINSVIATLKEQGFINDEAYALSELDRAKRELRGPLDLARRLNEAVAPALARHTVSLYEDKDQEEVLTRFLVKKTKTLPAKPTKKIRESLTAAAIRRGFNPRFVTQAIRTLALPDHDQDYLARDAEKIRRRLSTLPPSREKTQKLFKRLLAKGYSSSDIRHWMTREGEDTYEE